MNSLPPSPPTSSPPPLTRSNSEYAGGAALRRFSTPIQISESSPSLPSPLYSAVARKNRQVLSSRSRSTSLDIPARPGSRTRRDSLEVERERRRRRYTFPTSPSLSPSHSPPHFAFPSSVSAVLSRYRGRDASARRSWIHQPASIRPRSAAFLRNGARSPPPPYRPQSPDLEYGVVEGWEEVPNPNYVPSRAQQGVEDVLTVEHIEYASGFRTPSQDDAQGRLHEEDVPTVEHIEYCSATPLVSRSRILQGEEDVPTVEHIDTVIALSDAGPSDTYGRQDRNVEDADTIDEDGILSDW